MIQTRWARTIVAALRASGVRAVVLSPGSRSTPLAAALDQIETHVVIDERAAGFFALGLARASGAPVALVCTSGTAAAHYYPAVIEASMAGVPLVVLTADRPPELHDAGASQTIDQLRLYGAHARSFVDLGPPSDGELALRAVHRRVAQAVLTSRWPRPGPIQVNVPLRKPLEPAAIADALPSMPAVPTAPAPARADDDAIAGLAAALTAARRPVVLAGPRPLERTTRVAAAVSRLARRHGAVVCAELTSQLRGLLHPEVVALDAFDLVPIAPDLVLHLGAEPVAASWPRGAPRWIVAEHAAPDADACAAGIVLGDVADILERASDAALVHADQAWLATMRDAAARAAAAIADLAGPETEHAAVAAALAGAGDALVVIGNSLPVRLADHVPLPGPRRVICQRGASGIDGLIAGAAGAAAAGEPVVLILGDVSLAHDAGALALLRHTRAPVTVVVIDNDGGRIFEALPVAGAIDAAALERLWLTPPRLDVVALARGFGLEAVTVRSPDALRAAVSARRTALLHVPVAPSSARAVRQAAIARLAAPTRERATP